MLLCVIKGVSCFWLFDALNEEEAIRKGLEILSDEPLFVDHSAPPYSQSGIKISFFDQKAGHCNAISESEEEIYKIIEKKKILVIVQKE